MNRVSGAHSAWAASLTWKETVGGVGVNSQIAYYTEDTTNTDPVDGGKGRSAIHGGLRLAYQGFDVGYAFGRFLQSEAGHRSSHRNQSSTDTHTVPPSPTRAARGRLAPGSSITKTKGMTMCGW